MLAPPRMLHGLPHPALRGVIDRYWSWAGAPAPLLPLVPGPGGLELFFHHRQPFAARWASHEAAQPLPQAHALCIRSRPMPLQATGEIGFIAARIRAGCAGALAEMLPLQELADRPVPLEAVWGAPVQALLDALAACGSFTEQAAQLDSFFLARLREARPRDAPIRAAIARLEREPLRIAALARECGLSVRQFEARFSAATGSSPVRFRRLARLRRSIKQLLLAAEGASLVSTMDEAYFDQAQQIREFREFTGRTPGQFRREAAAARHFYLPSLHR